MSVAVSELKKDDIIFLDDKFVQVTKLVRSKNGKHGHCKTRMTGKILSSGKNTEQLWTDNQLVCIVKQQLHKYQVIEIKDNTLSILNDKLLQISLDIENDLEDALIRSLQEQLQEKDSIFVTIQTLSVDEKTEHRVLSHSDKLE